jgi:hypothetical protein
MSDEFGVNSSVSNKGIWTFPSQKDAVMPLTLKRDRELSLANQVETLSKVTSLHCMGVE